MVDLLKWFVFLEVIGWVLFPLSFNLFKGLADRGISITKILGLLLWGYIYWLGNTFQIITNDFYGAVFAFLIIIVISCIVLFKISIKKLIDWCKNNIGLIVFYEILFQVTFVGWAVVRGANPEIIGTEKPMELAFITSIYRSPSFPPNDPWLSNYAISYYYFGYLLISLLMRLCGTVSGIAFNLAISAWFGLVSIASSGILYNLLFFGRGQPSDKKIIKKLLLLSLLAPIMILIVSNGEGILEIIHSRGIFWSVNQNHTMISSFWKWIDLKELTDPPPLPLNWLPGRAGGTWWWRASRVLQDYALNGQSREIIDEFPFFSFLLADLHPHVLSMPFVLMVIYTGFLKILDPHPFDKNNFNFASYALEPQFWIFSFILGSLIFINTWDFPIYLGFFVIIFAFQKIKASDFNRKVFADIILYSICLGLISLFLYFPFILGLSSQAGGFLPSLIYRTRGIHFLIMFFPHIFILLWIMIYSRKNTHLIKVFSRYILVSSLVALFLLMVSLLLAILPNLLANIFDTFSKFTKMGLEQSASNFRELSNDLLGLFGADSINNLIYETLNRIIESPYVILFLITIISLSLIKIFNRNQGKGLSIIEMKSEYSFQFILILIILGTMLCLFPEFFYLKDQFGWRMNTIFKFYFQAWIIFAVASAYSILDIFAHIERIWIKTIYITWSVIIIGTCLVYPIFAICEKTNSFQSIVWSLDGNQYFQISNPQEYEAILFLEKVPYGIVAEAVGGSYSNYGRVSRISGLPTVLGWPGHESQWRGGAEEIGSRESDIRELYVTSNWDYAKKILDTYKIRYIFIGQTEKITYPVSEIKFENNLAKIFDNKDISIYQYTQIN